jgi:hypothetical protein
MERKNIVKYKGYIQIRFIAQRLTGLMMEHSAPMETDLEDSLTANFSTLFTLLQQA